MASPPTVEDKEVLPWVVLQIFKWFYFLFGKEKADNPHAERANKEKHRRASQRYAAKTDERSFNSAESVARGHLKRLARYYGDHHLKGHH